MTYDDRPDPAKRLEQARTDRGFATPRDATNYFGWSYDTYIQHENGIRGITRAADTYAKAYRVSKAWLLTGQGEKAERRVVKLVGYVGAGARIYPVDGTEGDQVLDEVELDFPLPEGTVAAVVRGDSMLPVFEDGDLIGYHRTPADPYAILNRTCIVKVVDGPMYVKTLKRGSSGGLFTLVSFNASDIEDVAIEWAAPFQFRVSRFQWRT